MATIGSATITALRSAKPSWAPTPAAAPAASTAQSSAQSASGCPRMSAAAVRAIAHENEIEARVAWMGLARRL